MAALDDNSPRGVSSGVSGQYPGPPEPLSVEVLSQLVEQECSLQRGMARVLDLFHAPLAERSRGIVTFAQHWALFANFGTLCEAHGRLCASMTALLRQVRQDLAEHQHQALVQQQQHVAAKKRTASAAGGSGAQHLQRETCNGTAPVPVVLHVASASKTARAPDLTSPGGIRGSAEGIFCGGGGGGGGAADDATSTSPGSSSYSLQAAGSMEVGGSEGATATHVRTLFAPTGTGGPEERHVDPLYGLVDGNNNANDAPQLSPPPAALPSKLATSTCAAASDEPSAVHVRTASQSTAELLHPPTPLFHGRAKSGDWVLSDGLLIQSSGFQTEQDEVSVAASTTTYGGGGAQLDSDETWSCDADVLATFCGPQMMHFLAEHMMYALHYAKTISPTLTELIAAVQASPRGMFAPPLTTGGATNASGAALEARGEAPLLSASSNGVPLNHASQPPPPQYGAGVAGGTSVPQSIVPADASRGRVDSNGSAGNALLTATASMPTTAVVPLSADASTLGNKDRYKPLLMKYRKFLLYTIHTLSQSREDELHLKRLTMPEEDPLSPRPQVLMDCGPVVELLLLLGSPLSSLQRLLLAVRSLVECQCLSGPTSQEVVTRFLLPAYQRSAEEGSMVLEQVAQQDVAAVLATFDDFSAPMHEGRVLLHSGHLIKKFRRGRHERLMFVFNDLLCYVEELSNGRNRVRGIIPLDTMPPLQVVDLDDDLAEDRQFAFQLVLPAPGRSYLFFCTSPAQKRVWLDILRFATSRLERAKATAERLQMTGDVAALVRTEVELLPKTSRLERQRRQDERLMRSAARAAKRRASGIRSAHGVGSPAVHPHQQMQLQGTSPALTATSASQMTAPGLLMASTGGTAGRGATGGGSSHRRQASLRGSFAASELAAATLHERVRSSDSLRFPSEAQEAAVSPTRVREVQNNLPGVDDSVVSDGRGVHKAVFGPLFSVTRLPTKATSRQTTQQPQQEHDQEVREDVPRDDARRLLATEGESKKDVESEAPVLQPLDGGEDVSERLRIAAAVVTDICAAAIGELQDGSSEA